MRQCAAKMTQDAAEARRAYMRKWNQDHPDRAKAYQKKYWEKKAAEAKAAAETAEPVQ